MDTVEKLANGSLQWVAPSLTLTSFSEPEVLRISCLIYSTLKGNMMIPILVKSGILGNIPSTVYYISLRYVNCGPWFILSDSSSIPTTKICCYELLLRTENPPRLQMVRPWHRFSFIFQSFIESILPQNHNSVNVNLFPSDLELYC